MSGLFKKPRRNFRSKRAENSDSDGEKEEGNAAEISEPKEQKETLTLSEIKKLKKKKKEQNPAPASTLSFAADEQEADGEIFKVKKSSHSKRVVKQLRKESRKEKEERLKAEKDQESSSRVKKEPSSKNGSAPAEMELGSDGETRQGQRSPTPPSLPSEEEDDQPSLHELIRSGEIPDAKTIHMIRKQRQYAREMGDYVPLDDTVRVEKENTNSRLVRDDENDRSDEGEDGERIDFAVNTRDQELRSMQDKFLAAQEEKESSDQELEWEEQQIRKGTNIPQSGTSGESQQDYYNYQPFLNNTPAYTDSMGYSTMYASSSSGPKASIGMRMGYMPPTDLPQVKIEDVKKRLQSKLEDLSSVHRAHVHERDDLASRMESSESFIDNHDGQSTTLENQYRFYQEMRGYVRDLVECLNDKVPKIGYLERSALALLRQRADKFAKRRQEDVKDQSMDYVPGKAGMLIIEQDPAKQRRIAEREARRSRRRRARQDKEIRGHDEGMSTDDEENQSEITKFTLERDQSRTSVRELFEDVVDDFHELTYIKQQFQKWRDQQNESYTEAYIALCLPKLFTPFIKLKLVDWNPLEKDARDFEEMGWYETLMFYGYKEGAEIDKSDPDIKLMPSIVDRVLLPKLTGLIENVWDPLSSQQTRRLVQMVQKLVRDYPTVTSESKNTQALVKAAISRIKKTIDDDVFMPLYPMSIFEEKRSTCVIFFFRQFWTCAKLMSNILLWHGIISETLLRELALDSVLNRYMTLALNNSPVDLDSVRKCQKICTAFPKDWFVNIKGNETLSQLEPFCRCLMHIAESLDQHKGLEKRFTRDGIKQVTKMLVNIHAMDHALALGGKFSLKV